MSTVSPTLSGSPGTSERGLNIQEAARSLHGGDIQAQC